MGRWVWGAGKYTCRSGYAILCISPRSPLALPQGDGALDQRESAGNKVLINWRAYTDMHRGTQSFITQMVKMVGTEPLEASGGNTTLLPTYRVCEVTSCTPNVPYLSPLSFEPSCLPSIRRPSRLASSHPLSTLFSNPFVRFLSIFASSIFYILMSRLLLSFLSSSPFLPLSPLLFLPPPLPDLCRPAEGNGGAVQTSAVTGRRPLLQPSCGRRSCHPGGDGEPQLAVGTSER